MKFSVIEVAIVIGVCCTAVIQAIESEDDEGHVLRYGCKYNGIFYKFRRSFPAGDGCNVCFCRTRNSVSCTRRACSNTCEQNGVIHKVGDTFPSGDGCNSCQCTAPDKIVCTLIACGCELNEVFHNIGDTFPAGDGCNTCTCIAPDSTSCTEKACGGCRSNGDFYKVGQTFPADDGCNTCTCTSTGSIACTKKACICPVRGQVFNRCGSACPANCTDPEPPCTKECVPRCECPSGTVIDEISGSCVTVDECPTQCPPDQPVINCFVNPCRFAKCSSHPGAECVADFCGGCKARFFDDEGNEITDSCNCPIQGQLFMFCASSCPANCTTPNPPCTQKCVARCECPRGTVINEATKTCVPEDECPTQCPPDKPLVNCLQDPCRSAKCPANPDAKCVADYCGGCNARFFDRRGNEVECNCPIKGQLFNECGSACPANCTTPNPPCTRPCVARCECPRGTVINEATKTCVPEDECPTQCPPTQIFNTCGSACTPTCTRPSIPCTLQCVDRCECPRGTVLNEATKTCVPVDKCPTQCPPTQIFNTCGSTCTPTCTSPFVPCLRQCVARCECPKGTVLLKATKTCIPLSRCPPDPVYRNQDEEEIH